MQWGIWPTALLIDSMCKRTFRITTEVLLSTLSTCSNALWIKDRGLTLVLKESLDWRKQPNWCYNSISKYRKKQKTSTTWWSSTYTLNRYSTEGAPCTKPTVIPGPLSHENFSPCNHNRYPHWLKIPQILHVSLYLLPSCLMGKHDTFPANTAPYCFPTLSILKQVSRQHTNTIKVLYLLSLFYKIILSSVKLKLLKVLEWRYWLQQLYQSFMEIKKQKSTGINVKNNLTSLVTLPQTLPL